MSVTGVSIDVISIAQGSTSARTRLYQIGIAAFQNEVEEHFKVMGYFDRQWESFRKKRNYEAFLLESK